MPKSRILPVAQYMRHPPPENIPMAVAVLNNVVCLTSNLDSAHARYAENQPFTSRKASQQMTVPCYSHCLDLILT